VGACSSLAECVRPSARRAAGCVRLFQRSFGQHTGRGQGTLAETQGKARNCDAWTDAWKPELVCPGGGSRGAVREEAPQAAERAQALLVKWCSEAGAW